MMKIELKNDNLPIRELELDAPGSIRDLLKPEQDLPAPIISYKLDNQFYVNEDYLLTQSCRLELLTYNQPEGFRIYQDTAIFILAKALYSLFGTGHRLVIEHSIGDGVYCELFEMDTFTEEDCANLLAEMQRIVANKLPIEKLEMKFSEAEEIFSTMSRSDTLKNLRYYYFRKINLYRCGKFYDYYIRPLADNTGCVSQFDLVYKNPGFILRFPSDKTFTVTQPFQLPKKLFALHQEHDKWLDILKVHNMIDINALIDDYEISQFILVEEALHEKKIAEIATSITGHPDVRLVLIAGPSSSGKTTFAKRLSVQLQACKITPITISLDDYFLSRDKTPRKPNGDFDFENIHALDLELLNKQMNLLLKGEPVELPKYNFGRGVSQPSHNTIKLNKDNVIVMEGIHGLNDQLTASIPARHKAKIYISALNQLNIDNHNRIPTTDCRLIRRMVRDYRYRGYSADETLSRWCDVRAGEDQNIFPYQENADYMFNSSLTYELGVLKKYAWRMLQQISPKSFSYTEAQRLLTLLGFIKDIPDAQVPYNSIIREFTTGSIFRY